MKRNITVVGELSPTTDNIFYENIIYIEQGKIGGDTRRNTS